MKCLSRSAVIGSLNEKTNVSNKKDKWSPWYKDNVLAKGSSVTHCYNGIKDLREVFWWYNSLGAGSAESINTLVGADYKYMPVSVESKGCVLNFSEDLARPPNSKFQAWLLEMS